MPHFEQRQAQLSCVVHSWSIQYKVIKRHTQQINKKRNKQKLQKEKKC